MMNTVGVEKIWSSRRFCVHLHARHLNPDLGIFPSLDPVKGFISRPMSMNGYSYVEGNPVNWTDPSGMILPVLLTGAAAGFLIGGGLELASQVYSNVKDCGMSLGEALDDDNIDLGEIAYYATKGAVLGTAGFSLGWAMAGAGFGATSTFLMGGLVDTAFGAAWDVLLECQDPSAAVANNLFSSFVFGGALSLIGFAASRALRSGVLGRFNPFRRGSSGRFSNRGLTHVADITPDEFLKLKQTGDFYVDPRGVVRATRPEAGGSLRIKRGWYNQHQQYAGQGLEGNLKPRPQESPLYSVVFEVQLQEGVHYPTTDRRLHNAYGHQVLNQAIQSDPEFAKMLDAYYPGIVQWVAEKPPYRGRPGGYKQTGYEGRGPMSGKINLVWQHPPSLIGKLHLIPADQHWSQGLIQKSLNDEHGRGGWEIWGKINP